MHWKERRRKFFMNSCSVKKKKKDKIYVNRRNYWWFHFIMSIYASIYNCIKSYMIFLSRDTFMLVGKLFIYTSYNIMIGRRSIYFVFKFLSCSSLCKLIIYFKWFPLSWDLTIRHFAFLSISFSSWRFKILPLTLHLFYSQ